MVSAICYLSNITPTMSARLLRILSLLLLVSLLSACNKELYTDLTEKEGNDMLSILLQNNIDAEKISQKKGGLVTLIVQQSDMSRAITVLKNKGFPRDKFTSVGELFQKDGLISSPLEERARYIYALSQEVAETLSQLDGVITARVHVVMPESKDRKKKIEPASASVFIKYTESVKLDDFVPQIKMLVNNSIEGLSYDNITVGLFPSQRDNRETMIALESILSIAVAESSVARFYAFITVLLLALSGAIGGNIYLMKRLRERNTSLMEAQ